MTDVEKFASPPADVPATWAALMRLSARVHNTVMVPKLLRGRPDEVLAVMIHGAELGLPPITALRSIHMIEGQPSASAALIRALIMRHGHLLQWREVSAERVVLYGRRADTGSDALVTWTLDDARRANLLGKGNWKTYPKAMLAARATSEMGRLLFADLLHGISYTPEELGAVGPYAAIDVDYIAAPDDPPSVDTEIEAEDAEEWDNDGDPPPEVDDRGPVVDVLPPDDSEPVLPLATP
jgi:hypothetical protein